MTDRGWRRLFEPEDALGPHIEEEVEDAEVGLEAMAVGKHLIVGSCEGVGIGSRSFGVDADAEVVDAAILWQFVGGEIALGGTDGGVHIEEAAERLAEAQALAATMEEQQITVSIKVGEGGRTFGSISSKAMKKQLGHDIDKKKIVLKEQIKSVGTHVVDIKLHTKVTAHMTVKVTEEA